MRLEPGKPYTLSAWVLSGDPGAAWLGGGAGWRLRVGLPRTDGRWRLVSTTFTPGTDDAEFTFRINIDSQTPGVRVDDVKLEAGEEATPSWTGDSRSRIERRSDDEQVRGDGPFRVEFDRGMPRDWPGAVLESSLESPRALVRRELSLEKSPNRVSISGESQGLDDAPRKVALRLLDGGNEVARGDASVRFISASGATRRLEAIGKKIEARRHSQRPGASRSHRGSR